MESLAKKLNIVTQDDWYTITPHDIKQHGGVSLTKRYASLLRLMSTVFPEYQNVSTFLYSYISLESY